MCKAIRYLKHMGWLARRRARDAADQAAIQTLINDLHTADPVHVGNYGCVWFKHPWTVEKGVTADGRKWFRGKCPCDWQHGEWRVHKDIAQRDAERHPQDMTWNLGDGIYDD